MQLLRGINHHLLTPHADPLNPGENLKVLWMIVDTERKGEESEKKSLRIWAASSLMGRLWGLYELTINSLCRFPEWGIETNCLLAIQLHSSVPPDKKKKRKKRWLWRRITHKAVFETFPFCFADIGPMGRPPYMCVHSHTLTHHPVKWPFRKPEICQNRATLKKVIFQQLFLLRAV